ncbi:MAG: methylenetetrahydrofolate--tRNA-(uracil(54)-C(5))-methyltransferase (FADH(2)-oxidizing) TrmFO [Silvanigrellaceae bacterium]|nr:methylenetetrahydrofolate--tRNA-(uracil(54)-C(5))-methyltransferase (FADH(2)-oxidizing) TrmFO [Silvanigrellaceae bacterium]
MNKKVAVIGAGLAGCETSWILAEHYGVNVTLFEGKKIKPTPAQVSPHLFAELVCSNSLKSTSMLNPAGVLKNEIASLGSLVVPCALQARVPAGEALAVDREFFSSTMTKTLQEHKNITVVDMVVHSIAQIEQADHFDAIVVATGPLTENSLADDLRQLSKSNELYFYDAIAPIIDGETIDLNIAFKANRETRTSGFQKKYSLLPENQNNLLTQMEHDSGDYLNLPLSKEEYYAFVNRVLEGNKVPHHEFEEPRYFNGCQPIEVLAESGPRTLSFGPMKPKGLIDPHTGREPYAAIQLRKEKMGDTAWNMVGFQTRLTWTAQKEIFRTLPGLQQAEFFRMGSMHRNTYFVSPDILTKEFSFKNNDKLYLAGQIMGVEGYLESAAMGVLIGHTIGKKLGFHSSLPLPPANTSLGCLARYTLETEAKRFSPMNIHWGLFDDVSSTDLEQFAEPQFLGKKKLDKSEKRFVMAKRAQHAFQHWLGTFLPDFV